MTVNQVIYSPPIVIKLNRKNRPKISWSRNLELLRTWPVGCETEGTFMICIYSMNHNTPLFNESQYFRRLSHYFILLTETSWRQVCNALLPCWLCSWSFIFVLHSRYLIMRDVKGDSNFLFFARFATMSWGYDILSFIKKK